MKTINEDEYFAALVDVVKENPNYVYRDEYATCHYYNLVDGSPMCLFGHVFDRLGVKVAPDYNAVHVNEVLEATMQTDKENLFEGDVEVNLSESVIEASALAQDMQDEDKTWAEAFKGFCQYLNRDYNEDKKNE